MTAQSHSSTRRRFLTAGGAVIGTSTLSGCFGLLGPSDVITKTVVTGKTLAVTLAEKTDATMLTFVSPNGQPLWESRLSAGQSRVSIPLLTTDGGINRPIPPGTYKIVAGNDGEELDSQKITLTQSMTLGDIAVVTTTLQSDSGSGVTAATDIAVTITNTGTLPLRLTYLGLPKGVPQPSESVKMSSFTGMASRQTQMPPSRQGLVLPDRTATFQTTTEPLRYYENSRPPASKRWHGESGHCQGAIAEATLVIVAANNLRKERTFPIKYAGKQLSTQALDADWVCTSASIVNQSGQKET